VWNDSFICEPRDAFIVPLQLRVSAPASVADAGKKGRAQGERGPTFQFLEADASISSCGILLDCARLKRKPKIPQPPPIEPIRARSAFSYDHGATVDKIPQPPWNVILFGDSTGRLRCQTAGGGHTTAAKRSCLATDDRRRANRLHRDLVPVREL
jgi:hypothetical protein